MYLYYVKPRLSWFALILLLVTLVMTSCGQKNPSSQEPATITFAAWEYEKSSYQSLADRFMAEHPNIKIVLVPIEHLIRSSEASSPLGMLRQIVSGADTAPSLMVTPDMFDSNLLLDLKPLMDGDSTFKRDDFYPGTLEYYTTGEQTWVLPRGFYTQIIAYNKDLLNAANIPTPALGWSWNDLLTMIEQLAKKQGNAIDTYGFVDPTNGFLTFSGLLQANGIDLLHTQDVQLNTPEIRATIERMQRLVEKGAMFYATPPIDGSSIDPQHIIRQSKVGFWDKEFAQDRHQTAQAQTSEPLPFAIGTLPYPKTDMSLTVSGAGYIISRGTQHPEQAWAWIEFLSRQSIQPGEVAMAPRMVPARQSLAQATKFWDGMDEETIAAYKWSLEHSTNHAIHPINDLALQELSNVVMRVIGGDKQDIATTLATAQKQFEERAARIKSRSTEASTMPSITVATPMPQSAPEGATTITFASMDYNPADLRQLAEMFHQQQSNVFVEIEATNNLAAPLQMNLLSLMSDCFAASIQIRNETDAKELLNLLPLQESDSTFKPKEYPSVLFEQYKYHDQLLGLPLSFNMRTLNYNQTAFDKAGIKPPTAAWTRDDFLAAAKALTSGEGDTKHYGYVPVGIPFDDFFFFIRQSGAHLATGKGATLRPNFDDPKVIAAIQWFIDLSQVHHVMPPVTFPNRRDDTYQNQFVKLVQNGQAGMWFDYGYGIIGDSFTASSQTSATTPTVQAKIAPLPIGEAGLSGEDLGFSSGLHISAHTKHPQACWEWLKFVSDQATLIRWGIPARTVVARSDEFLSKVPPHTIELVNISEQTMKHVEQSGKPFTPFQEPPEYYWLFEAVNHTIKEKSNLTQNLQAAQKRTLAFMECVAHGSKPSDCATQVDPENRGFFEENTCNDC